MPQLCSTLKGQPCGRREPKPLPASYALSVSFRHDGDGMSERVERYRLNAEKCLQLAQALNHVEAKRELLVMANAWLVLAAQREKNIETAPANETPVVSATTGQ